MQYLDFLHREFGHNWVIARRSPSIERRYGADVVCLSPQRYAAVKRQYRREFGDPHDAVRQELYMALKVLVEKHARPCFMGDPVTYEPEWGRAIKALEAEANAK